jgi:DNA-binding CsgD family transcriptional regulator
MHIRLVVGTYTPGVVSRIILRGGNNINYPVIWIKGENASLSLGKAGMEHELIIDGGYRQTVPIRAHAPLVEVSGTDSKLIFYDKVILQNNYYTTDDFLDDGETGDDHNRGRFRAMVVIIFSVLAIGIPVFLVAGRTTLRKRLKATYMADTVPENRLEYQDLSPREKDVYTLLLTELSMKEIAHALKLSYSGVNFHTQNLYRKLGIQSRTELLVRFGNKPE